MTIILRPYSAADAEPMRAAAAESYRDVEPFMPWCTRDYGIEQARQWVAFAEGAFRERTSFELAAFDERGEFVGACGHNQLDALNKRANVGYALSPWDATAMTACHELGALARSCNECNGGDSEKDRHHDRGQIRLGRRGVGAVGVCPDMHLGSLR